MVAGNKPGVRSRSSSPEPRSTNSERDPTPAKHTAKRQSPASGFRAKAKRPPPERNDDTLAESEISDLPTNSLDNIREKFQNCIEPCNQSDPVPAPIYQDELCGCDDTEVNTQRRPDPPPAPRRTPSPVRANLCGIRSSSKNVPRNKSPASLFRMTPKKPSPAKCDQEAPTRQTCGAPKKAPVEQPLCEPCDSTPEESDSYTTPKSIEGMRESLLSVIDGSFCDGPCSESVSFAAPAYRDVQCGTGSSLTATDPARCNANSNYYPPSTPAESYPRTQSRSACSPPSVFPVNLQENYSGCGGSSCGFHPSAFPAASDQSYPVRGQSACTCDQVQSSVSPPSNMGCNANACNDTAYSTCNQPTSPQPDEDCSCECEPGPESTCPAKRSAFQRFRCMFDRILRPGNASCQMQSANPYYTFQQDSVTPIPKRLVFNLVPGIPSGPAPCEKPPPPRKVVRKEAKIERITATSKDSFDRYTNKVDIYYFDHGNSGYYRTTDNPPQLITDDFLEKSDRYATQFWANIFGVCHVGMSYVTIFFLQLFRFVCYTFIRSPVVGFIQILADYVFKPILSIFFNGIVQTIFIFFFNIATSFRDLCEPLAQSMGFFLREIAHVCRAMRLVEVNNVHTHSSGHSSKEERCKKASSATKCGPCDVA